MTTDPKSAYPTIERLADLSAGTVGYQGPVLIEEAVRCWLELADCKAELALERECREVGKAPCGHSEQYCYTADEGKHIACLLCEHESRLAAHTEREGVTVPANIFQGALNYIRHVGANWTERGEKHPQQWIVDGLELAAANQPAPSAASGLALDMLLWCPQCGEQHVDKPQPEKGWTNPPHRSHECQFCGHVWRPSDQPTNGVLKITTKGKADGNPRPRYFATAADYEAALRSHQAPVGEGKLPMSERIPVCIPVTGLWLRQREGKAQVLFEWQSRWYFGIEETEGAPYSHILEVGGMASSKPDATSSPQTGGGS